MAKILIFFLSIFSYCQLPAQPIVVSNLQCQYQESPLGVEDASPHLGWQLHASRRNVMQSAYRVLVADNKALLQQNTGNVWDTKKVSSGQSIQVMYNGNKLQPGKEYFWKVMVWDDRGVASKWSEPSAWQMGLLSRKDWKGAQWIAYE